MGIEHFRIGKVGAPFRHGPARRAASASADASCATGAFYTSPVLGASYDSLSPLNISWQPDLNCLLPAPSHVDIYLDAPGADTPRLHLWSGVSYSDAHYSAEVMPRWWNSSASQSLQIMIVSSGTPPFLSSLPAGPVFTATYIAPSNGTTPAAADTSVTDGSTTVVSSTLSGVSAHHLTAGQKAAAVILPLLFAVLLGFAYLKFSRMRGKKKRSEWSEKLDKRMSTISSDWKAITPGGAREAVRQSIATSRQSMAFNFSAGQVRTSNVEGEPVVMGEKPPVEDDDTSVPRTSLGSGVGVGVGARRPRTHATPPERGSRAVSFADTAHPRPSLSGSVYSRTSRAYHTASTYGDLAADGEEAPPVPALPSPSRISAYGNGNGSMRGTSVYSAGKASLGHSTTGSRSIVVNTSSGNASAWSSGERVEGVDGGYGARSVSPTGRVHSVNYPDLGLGDEYAAYGNNSYFSPITPEAVVGSPVFAVYEPSAESAYAGTTFGEYANSSSGSESGLQSGLTSPRQTAGPLTLTPEDIRRRMAGNAGQGQEAWRQSVDEVFGALSLMRTGSTSNQHNGENGTEDDGGDYLFAPVQETVFAYPGTPAPSSGFSTPSSTSPFPMPMKQSAMSPDEMLRAYASSQPSATTSSNSSSSSGRSSPSILSKALPLALKGRSRASTHSAVGKSPLAKMAAAVSPLSNSTQGAEVVPSLHGTGMRVLYDQGQGQEGAAGKVIPAGPKARLSR